MISKKTVNSSTGLYGPYSLTSEMIDEIVLGKGPGAYILLDKNADSQWVVKRVGRSDTDLNARLHSYGNSYTAFHYGFMNSVKEAYEKECELYHAFNPPDNEIHPDKPTGTSYSCPVPGCPH